MTTLSQKRAARKSVDLDQDITAALPAIETVDDLAEPGSLLQRLIRLREVSRVQSISTHDRVCRLS